MVFSSAVFLFIFLPAVFILYSIIPNLKIRNALLVAASLVFYAFGEPVYVLLMIGSVFMNYVFGRFAAKEGRKAKVSVALSVVANLLLLTVFKYTDFLIGNLNSVFSLKIPLTGIELPIGISFFTFQALSYVIDVYRDKSLVQKNVGKLMLYISFFPQLIAGPIVRYGDIAAEIENRRASATDVAEGLRRFIFGLSKKLLIANTAGLAADKIFAMNGADAAFAWFGAVMYCLQIYYDFSGYSDMAIGLGRMFGFHFKENFNYPYCSASIQEFWRRWHISLSGWFKSYLYIPLGGNRKGKARTYLNKYIVFFCTGLWHGASWNFVIWGLIHGTFIVLEDTLLKPVKNRKIIGRIYTIIVVMIAFVLFRADTLSSGFAYIANMFSGFSFGGAESASLMTLMTPWLIFISIAGIVLSLPVVPFISSKIKEKAPGVEVVTYIAAMALFVVCVLNLSSASFNPFIYFRF